jgi:putative sterol carrier protein
MTLRKRSEIHRPPNATEKALGEGAHLSNDRWCGEEVSGGIRCDLLLEYRPQGLFCTVHGYNIPVLDRPRDSPRPNFEGISETSQQLKEQLATSATEEIARRQQAIRKSGSRPDAWPSANRAEEKPIREDFARISEKVFIENPEPIYADLEKKLRVGEERSDRATLHRAVDDAEHMARLAHRLWITAKLEQQRYEMQNKIVFSAMRDEATRVLQREKDQKTRSKQITEDDVDMMCAQLFADEYEQQTIRRKKAELMVKSLENLAEMWNKRCSALESMLGKAR